MNRRETNVSLKNLAAMILTLSIACPPGAFADPAFVGSFGGGDTFRDRPAADVGAYSERAAQPLPQGRYNNNTVVTSGDNRNDGGNVNHPLFTSPVNRSQTMVRGESSLGNLGGSNALALTTNGRETVSAFLMPRAEAESHDGTYNRPNGADNLKGLANVVAAKLVRGEAVTPAELGVLNRAAEVDNMMTEAQGKPPTALARVAAIASSAQTSKLTTGQKVELRTILDHSAFYVRENDNHQITSVGATLVAPRPSVAAPPSSAPEGQTPAVAVAPMPKAVQVSELKAENPGAAGAGGDIPGGNPGNAPAAVDHPVPGAAGAVPVPPAGAVLPVAAGGPVHPVAAGAGVPAVAGGAGAPIHPAGGAGAGATVAAIPAAIVAIVPGTTGTHPAATTSSLPNPAANLPLPPSANFAALDATIQRKMAAVPSSPVTAPSASAPTGSLTTVPAQPATFPAGHPESIVSAVGTPKLPDSVVAHLENNGVPPAAIAELSDLARHDNGYTPRFLATPHGLAFATDYLKSRSDILSPQGAALNLYKITTIEKPTEDNVAHLRRVWLDGR